jgi:uncharacterized membrane-anchored protein YhcB (DUF1043 family)
MFLPVIIVLVVGVVVGALVLRANPKGSEKVIVWVKSKWAKIVKKKS